VLKSLGTGTKFRVIFIETSLFTKLINHYLTDEAYLGLQKFLFQHPEAGNIIRQTGGVRKLGWAISGKG
jgi:hypothetical protein